MTATRKARYTLPGDILNSRALAAVLLNNGAFFLPQAFPEGSPQHPSYPQGHATMAGACATILKAAFDGDVAFNTLGDKRIVRASRDGLSLVDYTGSDASQITVNGENEKFASNIGQARDFAGISLAIGLRVGPAAGGGSGAQRPARPEQHLRRREFRRVPDHQFRRRKRNRLNVAAHPPAGGGRTGPIKYGNSARSGLTPVSSGLRCSDELKSDGDAGRLWQIPG
jgi:hypothetical protein